MRTILILIFLSGAVVYSQGVFEDALQSSQEQGAADVEINGYMRGVSYGGLSAVDDDPELKSVYGDASLQLRARKGDFGNAYAEVRFREGVEYNESVSKTNLREAYVTAYVGAFDIMVGQQIVVWGRADGMNPTNNLTPYNMLVRSPDEDDRRESNFLMQAHYNAHPFRLEAVWVPTYAPSILPVKAIPLPPLIKLEDPVYPDAGLDNSAYAARLDVTLPAVGFSVSYFNGYNPLPGIDIKPMTTALPTVMLKAWRASVYGADFSTTIGSFGLRGEAAYRNPHKDYNVLPFVPNPDFQYVVGMDKSIGDFSVIAQYIGRYVMDFKELTPRPMLPSYELEMKNRMISFQLEEITHAVSGRLSQTMLFETLTAELFGMYNITTESYLARPQVSYELTDELSVTAGAELFGGPEETLYGAVDKALSAGYVQLKALF